MIAPATPDLTTGRALRRIRLLAFIFGNTLAAIRLAPLLRVSYVIQTAYADRQCKVWVLSDPTLRHFTWEWTGRHRRFLWFWTVEERTRVKPRAIAAMTSREVGARRTAQVGGRRPRRASFHFAEAAKCGVALCLDTAVCDDVRVCRRLHRQAREVGATWTVLSGPTGTRKS